MICCAELKKAVLPARHHSSKDGKDHRNGAIDLLRVLACIGIIWFHVHAPGGLIGYGGLPAFMMISVAFAARSAHTTTLSNFAVARARRLLAPWVAWSVLYGMAELAKARILHTIVWPGLGLPTVLVGTSLHLWYLPFAFFVSIGVAWIAQNGWITASTMNGTIHLICLAFLVVACSIGVSMVSNAVPFAQWVFILPATAAGLAFAKTKVGTQTDWSALLSIVISVLAGCVVAQWVGYPGLVVPYVTATVASAIAWGMRASSNACLDRISALSFGAYLVHPLVTTCVHAIGRGISPVWCAILVTFVSFLITAAIRSTRARAFV